MANETSIKLYIIVYSHRHGIDTWPTYETTEPCSDDVIEKLRAEGTWDETDEQGGSYVDVAGPFPVGP